MARPLRSRPPAGTSGSSTSTWRSRYWKLACILEGVYARYVAGAMGDDGFDFSGYPTSIAWLAVASAPGR